MNRHIFRTSLSYRLIALFITLNSCHSNHNVDSDKTLNIPKKEEHGSVSERPDTTFKHFNTNKTSELAKDILCIFQDSKGHFWFGSNDGAFCFDGKTLFRFSEQDGLTQNQVQSIQEDKSGNIWFGTGGFGVCCFDGKTFTSYTKRDHSNLNYAIDLKWERDPEDLWFCAGSGPYRVHGKSISYLPFPAEGSESDIQKKSPDKNTIYSLYCLLKDRKGNLWFGTQAMGVCRYDGKSFSWYKEKGLSPPAVRAIFEDRNGTLWFGNNGAGLFYLKGDSLYNFTREKGLSNDEFWKGSKITGKPKPGTLSRIWSIEEDNAGNIWIGTIDNGVWKYDGKELTNYTTKDGLTTNAIHVIYKDRSGELWFGTEGGGLHKFNGNTFTGITFQEH